MFRHHLGALALLAAFALPLAASAETVPAPGAAGPPPGMHQRYHQHRRHGDPYMRAMRSLQLSDAQKQQIRGFMKTSREALRRQIEGVLSTDQRSQLQSSLARGREHMKPGGSAPAPQQ